VDRGRGERKPPPSAQLAFCRELSRDVSDDAFSKHDFSPSFRNSPVEMLGFRESIYIFVNKKTFTEIQANHIIFLQNFS